MMKKYFITFFLLSTLLFNSISYWDDYSENIVFSWSWKTNTWKTNTWKTNTWKTSIESLIKLDDKEIINNVSDTTKNEQKKTENDTDKIKLEQNLNKFIIEAYKAKLNQILDELNSNIKDEKKETQIKILSNVLISVNDKIGFILPKKNIWKNRKEVLLSILKHIKWSLEQNIKNLIDKE